LLVVAVLSLVSGFGDALGFVHAARIWQGGRLAMGEVGRSGAGFAVGIGAYWMCVKYLGQCGVVAAEAQTLVWFGATMLGVALVSGQLLHWQPADQAVAVLVVIGIGWLMFRTG
jgi:hypothetical protein